MASKNTELLNNVYLSDMSSIHKIIINITVDNIYATNQQV